MSKKKTTAENLPAPNIGTQHEPKVVRANVNRRVEVSEGYVTLYANDAQIQMTPWDFRIILGQISGVPTEEDPGLLVRQIGDVRMSPQLTKKIVMILIGQLRHYEATIGPIAMPTD
jgi:hypothetical protein